MSARDETDAATHRLLYTDGGASPNPGPGGWGVVSIDPETGATDELSGSEPSTTNNRMELTAAIRALESVPEGRRVVLVTDSTYVRQGITQWMAAWRRNGWRRRDGKKWVDVKNRDLWEALAKLDRDRDVEWRWIKGHAGHEHNERADELATAAIAAQGGGAAPQPRDGVEPVDADVDVVIKVVCSRGAGGWAASILRDDEETVLSDRASRTTANRLDLEGAIAVLDDVPSEASLVIRTASDYLRQGASQWLRGWKRSGWKTKSGSPVKNRELWQELDRRLRGREIHWRRLGPEEDDRLKALDARLRPSS